MAVAKKDQERITYAWMYGAQARKDGKGRDVPAVWEEFAEAWLQGFDGEQMPGSGKAKPISDQWKRRSARRLSAIRVRNRTLGA